MLIRTLATALVTGLLALGTAGTATASTGPSLANVGVNTFNTANTGSDAGNDSLLEIDRSGNLAKGDGSPGSDIINKATGSAPVMSPGK
ncbi:hypothetical protein BTM25_02000 [Actinomadura rubteroloni]|uniref:Uncharacterized protein n=1 Tax=Actinomadura rubteroloni TaxID=1926885 RepID=A0A2P4UL85_9ACTN|nr:hypothetical protein [Actinomadura rubteroloni]POM25817.1 hypothetical protein BTM25_02000 [Actinomadura rubteroloni]